MNGATAAPLHPSRSLAALEAEAESLHKLAQRLNKEGHYGEAKATYNKMYALEDEALRLAAATAVAQTDEGDGGKAGVYQTAKKEGNIDRVSDKGRRAMDDVSMTVQSFPKWSGPRREGEEMCQAQAKGLQSDVVAMSSPNNGQRKHDEVDKIHKKGKEDAMVERALGAVLGSVLGDAAAMGIHWIYDPATLSILLEKRRSGHSVTTTTATGTDEALKHRGCGILHPAAALSLPLPDTNASLHQATDQEVGPDVRGTCTRDEKDLHIGLEFYQPPQSPFFSYPHGHPSPYGEQTLLLLHSLCVHRGFHPYLYAQEYAVQYGEGWQGYRDASTKGFLRRWYAEGGKEGGRQGGRVGRWGVKDCQANCFTRLPPLVLAFGECLDHDDTESRKLEMGGARRDGQSGKEGAGEGGKEERGVLHEAVESATRTTQDDDRAVMWAIVAAIILRKIVYDSQSIKDAISGAIAEIRAGEKKAKEGVGGDAQVLMNVVAQALEKVMSLALKEKSSVRDAVEILGKNCHLPTSLQTALFIAVSHASSETYGEAHQYEEEDPPRLTSERGQEGSKASGSGAPSSALPVQGSTPSNMATPTVTKAATRRGAQGLVQWKQQAFKRAIRAALQEGGCSASRAGWVGACLGGWLGRECLPPDWVKEVVGFGKIQMEAEEVIKQRQGDAVLLDLLGPQQIV